MYIYHQIWNCIYIYISRSLPFTICKYVLTITVFKGIAEREVVLICPAQSFPFLPFLEADPLVWRSGELMLILLSCTKGGFGIINVEISDLLLKTQILKEYWLIKSGQDRRQIHNEIFYAHKFDTTNHYSLFCTIYQWGTNQLQFLLIHIIDNMKKFFNEIEGSYFQSLKKFPESMTAL